VDAAARDQRLADYERRFRRAGLPLLSEDYSARSDVFNRAFPLLALVLLAELLAALDVDWSPLANVAAVAGALAATLLAVALVNRARGRRALAVPEDVGRVELALFALVPALVLGAVHGGWGLVVLAGNLALLGLVALTYGFGLGAIVVWAGRRLGGQLARSLLLLARAIPLLLFFSLVLFINTEMWQVFGEQAGATLVAIGLLLALVAIAFLAARLPREVARLEREIGADSPEAPPLRKLQRANVGLVLLISHGLQIVVVTVAIGGFFLAFGTIAIDAGVTRAWLGTPGHALFSVTVLDVPLRPTTELLRVSAAIAALSGVYYAITVLTDESYREEFLDEITGQMRSTFTARAEYLTLRASARAPAHP
jgi:MFS family permease